ncbi:PKD domain-containing protein [Methanofollis fontis]|uniref:PKD domain-containing protein n=1 Tax=Methanofollis fontis TaxID=2052832 RepID=A0A483CQR6_9EURY|nr:PKD domain-containing protein [Methanofollis fontis]TAJ45465.1 hypothetical protein CUJ86_01665 [Methanofollis fontis]
MHRTMIPGVVLILLMIVAAPAWAAPTDEIGATGTELLTYAAAAGTSLPNAADNATVIWSGTVEIDPEGTFIIVPLNTGTPISLDRNTPLGALDAASQLDTFVYEVWEADWGIWVERINDIPVMIDENGDLYLWWFHAAGYITNEATFKSLGNGERLQLIYAPDRDSYEQILAEKKYIIDMVVHFTNETEADFTADVTTGEAPLTVQFTDTSTVENIAAWMWDFGVENATSDEQNPTYTYEMPGTYTVSLTVTDEANVTYTEMKTDYINVTEMIPGADFSADVTEGEAPLAVQFTDTSTVENITEWMWDFGVENATSDEQNPTYIYEMPGVYTVSLTVTDEANVTYTEMKTDYINVTEMIPGADFSADVTEGEAPLAVQFTDTSTVENITEWMWDFGVENATSEEQNPAYTYEMPGTYTVSLTVTDEANVTYTEMKTDYINVTEPIGPEADFTADVTAGEAPLTVQFTDTSTVENITAWWWDFGNGYMSTMKDPLFTYHTPGVYNVSLSIRDDQDMKWTTVKEGFINVTGPFEPEADFAADVTAGEAPLTVNFTDQSTVENITEWMWDFGVENATSEEQNPTYTYEMPGIYTVSLTVTNEANLTYTEVKIDYINVTAPFTPEADFSADVTEGEAPLTVQFSDLSTVENITEWMWDFGVENATSDEQNPTYTYEMPGVYTVSLTVTDEANLTYTEVKEDYINVTEIMPMGADFSADVTNGTAPLTVNFTDLSTVENITEWMWDFGVENATSEEQNPTYTYEMPGVYTVSLTVRDMANVTYTEMKDDYITVT